MRLSVTCSQCFHDQGFPSFEWTIVDYFDDGIAYFTFSKGHETVILVQKQKFEMFLDSGSAALLQGFTMESCASFAAALERFYEYVVVLICRKREIPFADIEGMKKEMANQSERQLGAFMALHLVEFGKPYRQPQASISGRRFPSFRNAVIHKGLIPNVQDARRFCEIVYNEIIEIYNEVKLSYDEIIIDVTFQELARRHAVLKPGIRTSTFLEMGLFSLSHATNATSFDDALQKFEEQLKMREGLPAAFAHLMHGR